MKKKKKRKRIQRQEPFGEVIQSKDLDTAYAGSY
jgi:hypothetical protein